MGILFKSAVGIALILIATVKTFSQVANVQDSLTLVEFYDSTNGKNWAKADEWLIGPVKTWFGIVLDTDGYVKSIRLFNNKLTGSIPSSIGNLSKLEILTLGSSSGTTNEIAGSIPASLGNLTNLVEVQLEGNKLTGNIPGTIGNLTKLDYLNLSRNNLSGTIPASIGNLSNLTVLRLGSNQLTGSIPASIGSLVNLAHLELHRNQLTGTLPASMSGLGKLDFLAIGNNQLSGSPESVLSSLLGLRKIYIENNQFTDELPSLSNHSKLTHHDDVAIYDNKFTFTSIEKLVDKFGQQTNTYWFPQGKLQINKNDSLLSVYAGGTLANNSYAWYANNSNLFTKTGDSTLIANIPGKYHVDVYNTKVGIKPLGSDTIEYLGNYKVVDPNPGLVTTSGTLSTNLALLDTTQIVLGAVADGLSKLIIYTNSNIGLKFWLTNRNDGLLGSLNSVAKDTVATIFPVNGKIAAVYTPPDGMGNDPRPRVVTINVSLFNGKQSKTITFNLLTPPVVLVHGMWSGPDAWIENGFNEYLTDIGFEHIYRANYKDNNARSFNPNSPESIPGRKAVESEINEALNHYKKVLKVAAAQVDIVGHSLGGLMARSYSQQPVFKKNLNYHKGYIHKLITLGTPHRGSPLGPELIKHRDSTVQLPSLSPPYYTLTTVEKVVAALGMNIGTCHIDFGIESAGVKALTQTEPFRTFSITGDATGQIIGRDAMEFLSRYAFKRSFDNLMARRSPCVGPPLINDLVVPLNSQKGFFPNDAGKDTLLLNLAHSIPGRNTMLNSTEVMSKVTRLLLSADTTEFGRGFPAPTSIPLDCNSAAQRVSDNGQNSGLRTQAGQQSIKISSPVSGSVFQEGTDVTITAAFTVHNEAKPIAAMFVIGDWSWFPVPASPPYTVSFKIPSQSAIGSIPVLALAIDSSGVRMADTAHLIIQPAGTLDSMAVYPLRIDLDSSKRTTSIRVSGYYDAGNKIIMHDLTNSSTGTVYASKLNTVFIVNENGYVTAKGPGTDTLIITHKGKTSKVPVSINANFQQAFRYPNQIDFTPIPDQTFSDPAIVLSALSGAGDPVSFSVVSGPATLHSNILAMDSVGKITVKGSQQGNAYFVQAQDVQQTFCVNPQKPSVAVNGNMLTSSASVGNQWFVDGVVINGATGKTITATQSGVYQVQVSTTDGCKSKLSDSVNYRVTAINTPAWNTEISVFPNPASRFLYIRSNIFRRLSIEIVDQAGRRSLAELINTQNGTINIESLASGIYIIKLTDQRTKESIFRKIVKGL